jgi:hypothetical protein
MKSGTLQGMRLGVSEECPGGDGFGIALRAGFALSDLSAETLWLDYYAFGGSLGPAELADALTGGRRLTRLDHDRVALGLNEYFDDRGLGQPVPYAEELDNSDHPR